MAKPGQADDDDLVIELEGEPAPGTPPEEEDVVEDFRPPGLEAETVPGDGDDEPAGDDDEARKAGKDDGEEPSEEDDAYVRVAAAEEQVRQERANRIWGQAQAYAEAAETRINGARVALDSLKDRIETAMGGLAAAKEAGDIRAEMQIQAGLDEMRRLEGEIKSGLQQAPTRDQILAHGRHQAQQALDAVPQGKKVGSGIQARHPLAERWSAANAGWMRNNTGANNFVLRQAQRLTDENWDPNSPSFYAELSRLVKTAYPGLKVSALQAKRQGAGRAQMRGVVAPGRSSSAGAGGVSRSNGKTTFKLTRNEQVAMRRYNLDPLNKSHQKAWAKERMASAERQRQMGR